MRDSKIMNILNKPPKVSTCKECNNSVECRVCETCREHFCIEHCYLCINCKTHHCFKCFQSTWECPIQNCKFKSCISIDVKCILCENIHCNRHNGTSKCISCGNTYVGCKTYKCSFCKGSFCNEETHTSNDEICSGVLHLTDGIYEGYISEGPIAHGVGKMCYFNDDTYEGCFNKGLLQGIGTYRHLYEDTSYWEYKGEWYDNKRHGCGSFIWPDGTVTLREYKLGHLISEVSQRKESSFTLDEEVDNILYNIKLDIQRVLDYNVNKVETERRLVEEERNRVLRELDKMYKKRMSSIDRYYQDRKNVLDNVENTLSKELSDMENKSTKIDNIIKLCVGGHCFMTSKLTLAKAEGSFLGTLVSGRHKLELTKDGEIFIDRNGEMFGHILDYLRDGNIHISNNRTLKNRLITEAMYYGLEELAEMLN